MHFTPKEWLSGLDFYDFSLRSFLNLVKSRMQKLSKNGQSSLLLVSNNGFDLSNDAMIMISLCYWMVKQSRNVVALNSNYFWRIFLRGKYAWCRGQSMKGLESQRLSWGGGLGWENCHEFHYSNLTCWVAMTKTNYSFWKMRRHHMMDGSLFKQFPLKTNKRFERFSFNWNF